ncbi:unnamed protein product [Bemisia tabaci]|uniref:Uncharacterized protein n=1 Tax=Bemisia tabaci TaxID=7038 RepID=A0A9P0A175_BEMTA|nr:unnamed protein product [Bemisia tabaci]CAH0381965.1 unnamed protein product [Bemisia tabaci]
MMYGVSKCSITAGLDWWDSRTGVESPKTNLGAASCSKTMGALSTYSGTTVGASWTMILPGPATGCTIVPAAAAAAAAEPAPAPPPNPPKPPVSEAPVASEDSEVALEPVRPPQPLPLPEQSYNRLLDQAESSSRRHQPLSQNTWTVHPSS